MVPKDWDSTPRCIYGPNFISDLIGVFPIFSSARGVVQIEIYHYHGHRSQHNTTTSSALKKWSGNRTHY